MFGRTNLYDEVNIPRWANLLELQSHRCSDIEEKPHTVNHLLNERRHAFSIARLVVDTYFLNPFMIISFHADRIVRIPSPYDDHKISAHRGMANGATYATKGMCGFYR